MAHPVGTFGTFHFTTANGERQRIEMAIGPSETFGDLEAVFRRFSDAFVTLVDGGDLHIEGMSFCLFDHEDMIVAFDENDDGSLDHDDAMDHRFAFAFVSQLGEDYQALDPWLVVRPCTIDQYQVWEQIMAVDDRYEVFAYCLDEQLQRHFVSEE